MGCRKKLLSLDWYKDTTHTKMHLMLADGHSLCQNYVLNRTFAPVHEPVAENLCKTCLRRATSRGDAVWMPEESKVQDV